MSRFGDLEVLIPMTSSLRFPTVIATVVLAGVPLAGSACNAQLATVLSANDGGSGTSSSGGAACAQDSDCNANPAVSTLRGGCDDGRCVCAKSVAVTADGKCGDPIAMPDTGPELTPCEAKGGKCIPDGTTPPPTYQPDKTGALCGAPSGVSCWVPVAASGAPVCYNDAGCNEDPSVSALLGKCTFGICVCSTGTVQASGKCAATPAPECSKQAGTCRQMPATCNTGELASDGPTNFSCGDLVEAVCCLPGTSCKGGAREAAGAGWVPVDFYCCSPSKVKSAPLCVNGWRTCNAGDTPTSNAGGGC